MNTKNWIQHVNTITKDNTFGPIKQTYNVEGQLQNIDGPAFITPIFICNYENGRKHGLYVDIYGTQLYYFQNVLVPSYYITNPESIKFEDLITHKNAEVRSVGLRIYGFERLLKEEKLDVIDIDSNTKQMLLQWNAKDEDESFGVVRVFNGTINDDGTRNIYYLIVPPNMTNVKEAIAWTFYKDEKDYNPKVET